MDFSWERSWLSRIRSIWLASWIRATLERFRREELDQLEVGDAVSMAFAPNSTILATGSLDGTLRLWEAPGGRLLMEAKEHFGQVQRLVFTPGGTSLISGSQDGTILLWGIPSHP